ncbi:hypothetical protein TREMEDRAFT_63420 [Tremella mesenterica DSM 1558]|uniref:uncharacterized protein n=1 Tax=Tremella mesenterica (strain ATCC 24925 / CBS 8224 / DSM 1558 / NBRC 9311 / NRRL Y-6157 / RJB 2259-6 / UBC 559-6) TaxID=578456 RepID=UPI0003F49FFD|nr:uncharacterized protein TREMEDRAFT_63420 [Tremella mesenterica DSM 1558]EIW68247.1 hypothetical protein TREMEDRAFT_63420 [Tremella mesenterica DSM 1558]
MDHTHPIAGPSSTTRLTSQLSASETSEDEDAYGLGLDDILPEPESPLPPPFSFSVYRPHPSFQLTTQDSRDQLVLRLVGSHPLWGHHLWNTSRVLSDFLLRHDEMVKGKKVLELGAGAGLPAIISSLAGAEKTVITDYPDEALLENIRWNVDCNVPAGRRPTVEGHVWGRNVEELVPQGTSGGKDRGYDLLLLSDLVFNHSQHAALVQSVNALLSYRSCPPFTTQDPYPTPCILVFFTHHRPHLAQADLAFFPLLAQSKPDDGGSWAYEKVVEEWAGAMFEDDPGDIHVRGTVHGWRCWRVGEGEGGERPSRLEGA